MTVLEKICTDKRAAVAKSKAATPLKDLQCKIHDAPAPRGFKAAISEKMRLNRPGLIAEIKKASPSGGLIRTDFNPAMIAKAYENGGAACLSVLTDEPYFQGRNQYLKEARAACTLPVLRKDFMIDEYQIYESRVLGADCVLLIMAVLDNTQAVDFYSCAKGLGMDVLVEVHSRQELERALILSPDMIGINNRNLKTLDVDLATGLRLGKTLPGGILKIAESGIYTAEDLYEFYDSGFQGFLVGESLMRQNDLETAVRGLLCRP